MKKTFTVTVYEACDLTADWSLGDYVKTIFEAEEKIRFDDMERREHWRESQWYNHGRANPFEHHDYAVIERVGDAEIDVEDEEEEPSFSKLCEAVEDWQEGEYYKQYTFDY